MSLKFILISFFFCFCGCLIAQTNSLSDSESTLVDQLMEEELLLQEIMGMSIGIVKDGKIVYTKGYGYSDIDRKTPVTTTTVFNWASISKVLTAVAAFQLIEDGKLRKDSKAKTILKDIWTNPDDDNQITLSHLLSHRSGIRHYNSDRGDDKKANTKAYTDTDIKVDWNANQSVAIFNDVELKSTPGEVYRYSTYGYNLAGAMIDKISPYGYVGHITQRILGPLDTKSINVSRKPWTAFSKDCNGAVKVWKENEKRPVLPGGGWHSNIQDLTIFMNALINNSLLQNTSSLWNSVKKDNEVVLNNGYRFGLKYEFDTVNVELIVKHGGKHENVRTLMAFFPDSKLGFTVLINGGYGDANRVFRKLATLFGKTQKTYFGPLMRWEYLSDCDKDITALWTRGTESSIVRYGYSQEKFKNESAFLESKGYHLIDCEYFEKDDKLLMSGIFRKGGNSTKFIAPSPYDLFDKNVNLHKEERFQLTDVEVFQKDGKILWSGITSRQLNNPFILKGFSTDSFKNKIEEMKNEGRFLIDIESYQSRGELKWMGLFRSSANFEVSFLQSKSDFADTRSQLKNDGLILKDLEIIEIDGNLLYSGLFHPNNNGIDYRSGRTHSQISKLYNTNVADSLRLVDIERPFSHNR